MDISDFVTSTVGLLTAIGAAGAGMAAAIREATKLLRWVIRRRRLRRAAMNNVAPGAPIQINNSISISRISLIIFVLSVLVSGSILERRREVFNAMPLDMRLTKQAWDAYNKNKYENAIGYAEECISAFKAGANRDQSRLAQESAPPPPTGKVSVQERETIWRRGPLNATGTCFYIKGRSLEALGQKQESIPALREASQYTYARCWDPKTKIFWNPAEAAGDRLQLLEK
jgi:hypothetical protein